MAIPMQSAFTRITSIVADFYESSQPKTIFQVFFEGIKTAHPDKTVQQALDQYPVPQIVLIGTESTGKSATLENITKTEIFPTHSKCCTLCPIKVVMVPAKPQEASRITLTFRGTETVIEDEGSIKTRINAIFAQLQAATPLGYTTDVITVTFVKPNVVRIDLIDLPGIVAFPPAAKDYTTNMSLQYIRDPNNFLICVAPATLSRLNACEPIARILENNAQHRTIIALTMCDKLRPEDINEQLTMRVLKLGEELPGTAFVDCCAVINRANDQLPLLPQQQREEQWFREKILKGAKTAEEEVTLKQKLGIAALVGAAIEEYERFIKEKWLPRTANAVQVKIDNLQREIDELGPIPNETNIDEFKRVLGEWVLHIYDQLTRSKTGSRAYNVFLDQQITAECILSMKYVDDAVERTVKAIDAFDIAASLVTRGDQATKRWRPWRFGRFWDKAKNIMVGLVKRDIASGLRVLQPVIFNQLVMVNNANVNTGFEVFTCFRPVFQQRCLEVAERKGALQEDEETAQKRVKLVELKQKNETVKQALII